LKSPYTEITKRLQVLRGSDGVSPVNTGSFGDGASRRVAPAYIAIAEAPQDRPSHGLVSGGAVSVANDAVEKPHAGHEISH
jgi:hypothetical protein